MKLTRLQLLKTESREDSNFENSEDEECEWRGRRDGLVAKSVTVLIDRVWFQYTHWADDNHLYSSCGGRTGAIF